MNVAMLSIMALQKVLFTPRLRYPLSKLMIGRCLSGSSFNATPMKQFVPQGNKLECFTKRQTGMSSSDRRDCESWAPSGVGSLLSKFRIVVRVSRGQTVQLVRLIELYVSALFCTILQCLQTDWLVLPECKQNITSLRGQAGWAKMMSLGGKLTALACHPTKFVNKAE
jgi:hypothetical protein